MSQVKFKSPFAGKRVEIMAGWDQPFQQYFLTVFDLDAVGEECLWSTIRFPSDEDRHGTDRLRRQLDSMGISAPEGFWERVKRQEGDVFHSWKDGTWES